MLSLSNFRIDIFRIFGAMKDSKMVVEVSHHRHIYRIWVEKTAMMDPTPYQIKNPVRARPVLPELIDTEECTKCHSLKVSGICLNNKCD